MRRTMVMVLVLMISAGFLMSCLSTDEEEIAFYLSISTLAMYITSSNTTDFRIWMDAGGASSNSVGTLQEDWSFIISAGDTVLVEINKDNMYNILGEDLVYEFCGTIIPPRDAHVNLDNDSIEGDLFAGKHPDKIEVRATIHDQNGKVHNLSMEDEFRFYSF